MAQSAESGDRCACDGLTFAEQLSQTGHAPSGEESSVHDWVKRFTGTDDENEKLKCAKRLKNSMQLVHTSGYGVFLEAVWPTMREIFRGGGFEPQAYPNAKHSLRHTFLEVFHRLAHTEPLKQYVGELVITLMEVIESDNEENVVLALKVLCDIVRTFKETPTEEVAKRLIAFVEALYSNVDVATRLAFTEEKKRPNGPLIAGPHSLKVMAEVALSQVTMTMYNHHASIVQPNIERIVPLLAHLLASAGDATTRATNEAEESMLSAQIRTASLMVWLIRYQRELRSLHSTNILDSVLTLLEHCPEVLSHRKELLNALRHVIHSGLFQRDLLSNIERLLNERTLVGTTRESADCLRPVAYNLLHEVFVSREAVFSLEVISKALELFIGALHANSVALSVQCQCVRLLINLTEQISMPANLEREAEIASLGVYSSRGACTTTPSALLSWLFHAYANRVKALALQVDRLLTRLKREPQEAQSDNPNSASVFAKLHSAAEKELAESKQLTRHVLHGTRGVLGAMKRVQAARRAHESPHESDSQAQHGRHAPASTMPRGDAPVPQAEAQGEGGVSNANSASSNHTPGDSGSNINSEGGTSKGKSSAREGGTSDTNARAQHFVLDADELAQLDKLFGSALSIVGSATESEASEHFKSLALLLLQLDAGSLGAIMHNKVSRLVENALDETKQSSQATIQFLSQLLGSGTALRPLGTALGTHLVYHRLDHLHCIASPRAGAVLRLITSLFQTLSKSPADCEHVLKPLILPLLERCLAGMRSAEDSSGYIRATRYLFRTLSNVKSELLFKVFSPALHPCLDAFLSKLESLPSNDTTYLLLELCLMMPVKLNSLMAPLHRLQKPLLLALKSELEEVRLLGLRSLELWVESINRPSALEPLISHANAEGDLMRTLWTLVKPRSPKQPSNVAQKAMQILGKLSGRARRSLLEPPQLEHKQNPEHGLRLTLTFEPSTSFLIPLDRCINHAISLPLSQREVAQPLLRCCLLSLISNSENGITSDQSIVDLSKALLADPKHSYKHAPSSGQQRSPVFTPACGSDDEDSAAPTTVPVHGADIAAGDMSTSTTKTRTQLQAEREMFKLLLVANMQADPFASPENRHFAKLLASHFAALLSLDTRRLSNHWQPVPLISDPAGALKELPPAAFLDAVAEAVCGPSAGALLALGHFVDSILAVARERTTTQLNEDDGGESFENALADNMPEPLANIIPKLSICCHHANIATQVGGLQALSVLVDRTPACFIRRHSATIAAAYLYGMRFLPQLAVKQLNDATRSLRTLVFTVATKEAYSSPKESPHVLSLWKSLESDLGTLGGPSASHVRSLVEELMHAFLKQTGASLEEVEPSTGAWTEMITKLLRVPVSMRPAQRQAEIINAAAFVLSMERPTPLEQSFISTLKTCLESASIDPQDCSGPTSNGADASPSNSTKSSYHSSTDHDAGSHSASANRFFGDSHVLQLASLRLLRVAVPSVLAELSRMSNTRAEEMKEALGVPASLSEQCVSAFVTALSSSHSQVRREGELGLEKFLANDQDGNKHINKMETVTGAVTAIRSLLDSNPPAWEQTQMRTIERARILMHKFGDRLDFAQVVEEVVSVLEAIAEAPAGKSDEASTIVGILPYIPKSAGAGRFATKLIRLLAKIERAMKWTPIDSPLQSPLCIFLANGSDSNRDELLSLLGQGECTDFLLSLLERPEATPILNEIAKGPSATSQAMCSSTEGKDSSLSPGKARVVAAAMEHNPALARDNKDSFKAIMDSWQKGKREGWGEVEQSKTGYAERQNMAADMPRTLARCLGRPATVSEGSQSGKRSANDLDFVLELAAGFAHDKNVHTSLWSVPDLLAHTLPLTWESSEQRSLLSKFFEEWQRKSEDELTSQLELVVRPILEHSLSPNGAWREVLTDDIINLITCTFLPEGTASGNLEGAEHASDQQQSNESQARANTTGSSSAGDRDDKERQPFPENLCIQVVQALACIVRSAPEAVHGQRREVVTFLWRCVRRCGSGARAHARLGLAHFLKSFQGSEKGVSYLLHSLLGTFDAETRALTRYALDVLLPWLPSSGSGEQSSDVLPAKRPHMSDETSMSSWQVSIKKKLYEDAPHNMPQLVHLLGLIARHPWLFFPFRGHFLTAMLNSLNTLAQTSTSSGENRRLTVSLVGVILMWEREARAQENSDRYQHDTDAHSTGQPTGGAADQRRAKRAKSTGAIKEEAGHEATSGEEKIHHGTVKGDAISEPVGSALLRLAIWTSEGFPSSGDRSRTETAALHKRALELVEELAALYPSYQPKFDSAVRHVLSFDQQTNTQASSHQQQQHAAGATTNVTNAGGSSSSGGRQQQAMEGGTSSASEATKHLFGACIAVAKRMSATAHHASMFTRKNAKSAFILLSPDRLGHASSLHHHVLELAKNIANASEGANESETDSATELLKRLEQEVRRALDEVPTHKNGSIASLSEASRNTVSLALKLAETIGSVGGREWFIDNLFPDLTAVCTKAAYEMNLSRNTSPPGVQQAPWQGKARAVQHADASSSMSTPSHHPHQRQHQRTPHPQCDRGRDRQHNELDEGSVVFLFVLSMRVPARRALLVSKEKKAPFLQQLLWNLQSTPVLRSPGALSCMRRIVCEWAYSTVSESEEGMLVPTDMSLFLQTITSVLKQGWGDASEWGQQWEHELVEAILTVCESEAAMGMLAKDVFQKVEKKHLIGLRASKKEHRRRAFKLYDREIERHVMARLRFIVEEQNWIALADTFWLKQGLDLILAILVREGPVTLATKAASVPTVASYCGVRGPSEGASSRRGETKQVDGIIEDSKELYHMASGQTVANLVDSIEPLAHEHNAVAKHLWVLTFPIVWAILKRAEQTALAKPFITLLSKEHHTSQQHEPHNVVQALLEGISLSQPQPRIPSELIKHLGKQFNVWHVALPVLESHATLLQTDTRCWDALADLYRSLGEDDIHAGLWRARTSNELTCCGLALAQHNLDGAAQEVFLSAIEGERGNMDATEESATVPNADDIDEDSNDAARLDHEASSGGTEGMWIQNNNRVPSDGNRNSELSTTRNEEQGVDTGEHNDALSDGHQLGAHESSAAGVHSSTQAQEAGAKTTSNKAESKGELCLWEMEYMRSARSLEHWDTLADFAKMTDNPHLGLEANWRLGRWQTARDAVSGREEGVEESPCACVLRAGVAVREENLTAAENLCHRGATMALEQWWRLPEVGAAPHETGLHVFQQLVELQDGIRILSDIGRGNTRSMRDLFEQWQQRLPNLWEPLEWWSELLTFRSHVHSALQARLDTQNGAQQAGLAMAEQQHASVAQQASQSRNWIAAKLAAVARKQHEPEAALRILDQHEVPLNDFSTTNHLQVNEAFMKLTERVKAHLQPPKEGEAPNAGPILELLEETNLDLFPAHLKAELYRLKGEALKSAEHHDEAHKSFAVSVSLYKQLAQGWVSWGEHTDKMYKATSGGDAKEKILIADHQGMSASARARSFLVQSVTCHLQAARQDAQAHKSQVARVLEALALEDYEGVVSSALLQQQGEVPCWAWILHVPHLLQSTRRAHGESVEPVLERVLNDYPQTAYFSVRALAQELVLKLREQSNGGGGGNSNNRDAGAGGGAQGGDNEATRNDIPSEHMVWTRLKHLLDRCRAAWPLLTKELDGVLPPLCATNMQGSNEEKLRHLLRRSRWRLLKANLATTAECPPNVTFELDHWLMQNVAPLQRNNEQAERDAGAAASTQRNSDESQQRLRQQRQSQKERAPERQASGSKKTENAGTSDGRTEERQASPVEENAQDLMQNLHSDGELFPRKVEDLIERLQAWELYIGAWVEAQPNKSQAFDLTKPLVNFSEIGVPGKIPADSEPPPNAPVKLNRVCPEVHAIRRHGSTQRRIRLVGDDGIGRAFLISGTQQALTPEDSLGQFMRYMNTLFERHKDTRRRHLSLCAPVGVPMWHTIRITEEDESLTLLSDAYESNCARHGKDADLPLLHFKRQLDPIMHHPSHNGPSQQRRNHIDSTRLQAYRSMIPNHNGQSANTNGQPTSQTKHQVADTVFTQFVYKTLPTSNHMWQFKRELCSQISLLGLVNTILNIPAKAPHKLLFSKSTGEAVASELHPHFSPAGALGHSSTSVHLRLTRNIHSFFTSFGVHGSAVAILAAGAQAMLEPHQACPSHICLLLHDELIECLPHLRRQLLHLRRPLSDLLSSPTPTTHKLREVLPSLVQSVLDASSLLAPNASLSRSQRRAVPDVHLNARREINQATDANELCHMDPTWQPWL